MRKTKLVFGIGINDAGYVIEKREFVLTPDIGSKQKQKVIWRCPFYQTWKSMLMRCYSDKIQVRQPTYVGCIVCEEWLTFSNFKKCMEKQDWEGKQLDKDLLFPGNKIYNPETSVFLPQHINLFMIDCGANRGEWPIGVHRVKQKFVAMVGHNGKQKYLGRFNTPEEAHQAWLSAKFELACELASQQVDHRIAEALINRYQKYENNV